MIYHFNPEPYTVVKTDAGNYALECFFWQFKGKKLHAVAYHFRKHRLAERIYNLHNKELLSFLLT